MASISSLTNSSSSSSIYGTRNVISGLASGMDTETMIENAVQGYKLKITNLQQKRTKTEWQQEAYRSIIEKMVNFSNKYTSYTSNTNLMSASFFNSAVTTSTAGKFADLVSASGKTSSDVQILGVKQLATAATYTVNGIAGQGSAAVPTIEGKALDLDSVQKVSNISGSLTIGYGGHDIEISFDEGEIIESGAALADKINEKLGEQDIVIDGSTYKASDLITAKFENGEITLTGSNSNDAWFKSASGDIKNTLSIETSSDASNDTKITVGNADLVDESNSVANYLASQEFTFTLDGVSKKIEVGKVDSLDGLINKLNQELEDEFGAGKVTVSKNDAGDGLKFTAQQGSTMSISNGAALGLDNTATSYVNTSQTLGDILGDDVWNSLTSSGTDEDGNKLYSFNINGVKVGSFTKDTALESVITAINNNTDAGVSVSFSKLTNQFLFEADETGVAGKVELGSGLASALFGGGTAKEGQDAVFSMSVNGVKMETSRSSNSFDVDGLTVNLKGTFNYEDARAKDETTGFYKAAEPHTGFIMNETSPGNFTVEVVTTSLLNENGEYVDEQGRVVSTDSVLGGAAPVTETGSFVDSNGNVIDPENTALHSRLVNGAEAVTFNTTADADKIVDAIKTMIEDYNAMVTEIKSAYSTLPEYDSSGDPYEPLTDEDRASMSESAVESYEKKAKAGLLFGDNDLSSLYSRLRDAIQMTGQDGADLSAIGITTAYSDGLTTLALDENKLRSALETDPDKVTEIFTKSKENGSSTNGLMQALKNPLDMYAATTGATKGILVEKAGSPLAPTSIYQNIIQDALDSIDEQIDKWEEKLSDQIDYYNSKFTQLELLISEMNSQSSTLSGLMSGY